jgi:uncharacterized DUF497 family protein
LSEKVKKKIEDRGLHINEVLDKIFDLDNLIIEAKQNDSYELIYKYSGRYTLVVVLFINLTVRLAHWLKEYEIMKGISKIFHIFINRILKITSC